MSVPATSEQSSDTAEPKAVNHRPISRRIKAACDALVHGDVKTIGQAAAKANLSREHLSRELSKPHIAAYLHQKACRVLAIGASRAAAVKMELLDSSSDHVRDSASAFVLGLAGIKPKADAQVSVNIDIKAGYVIDLTDEPKLVQSTAQRMAHTDHINQVIDNVEE